jgi:hypothetical protein
VTVDETLPGETAPSETVSDKELSERGLSKRGLGLSERAFSSPGQIFSKSNLFRSKQMSYFLAGFSKR